MNVPPYAYWHMWMRNACCDVISRGLHHNYYMLAHILQLPKKGVVDLCLHQLATMYVQMHVYKIFSLRMIYAVDSYV